MFVLSIFIFPPGVKKIPRFKVIEILPTWRKPIIILLICSEWFLNRETISLNPLKMTSLIPFLYVTVGYTLSNNAIIRFKLITVSVHALGLN